jgi:hypothetical protein
MLKYFIRCLLPVDVNYKIYFKIFDCNYVADINKCIGPFT